MLALVTVHNHATLCFQLPCTCINVKHYDVHAKVHGGLLCRQARAQTVVEEYHEQSLVLAKMLISETIAFYLLCLGKRLAQVTYVLYVEECSHILFDV